MTNNNNVRIKGCGCRFRKEGREPTTHEECEYLCENHRNEFILKFYNDCKAFTKALTIQ
jgi:hypothetical protein